MGLTLIQTIFDRNLESKKFMEVFRNKKNYDETLDEILTKAQHIVEEQVDHFSLLHALEQTKHIDELVDRYVTNLHQKARMNGGFPNTKAMKNALFGQVAFRYEQNCEKLYRKIADKITE